MDREENISDSELPDLISEDGRSDNEQENNSSDHDELPDLGLALWKGYFGIFSRLEWLIFSLKTTMNLQFSTIIPKYHIFNPGPHTFESVLSSFP